MLSSFKLNGMGSLRPEGERRRERKRKRDDWIGVKIREYIQKLLTNIHVRVDIILLAS